MVGCLLRGAWGGACIREGSGSMAKMGGHVQPPVLCLEGGSGLLQNPWHVEKGLEVSQGPESSPRAAWGQ